MSPETLVPSSPIPDPSSPNSDKFNPTEFDHYIMSTYERYPITLDRGAGCRVWDIEIEIIEHQEHKSEN